MRCQLVHLNLLKYNDGGGHSYLIKYESVLSNTYYTDGFVDQKVTTEITQLNLNLIEVEYTKFIDFYVSNLYYCVRFIP